ncbi:Uncharacterised protein [Clostridium perfringens]|uniref:TIR domain-containing protein n=1 Tax=Clostridium perfringens TaxID=1502 RepID=A0A2X3E571_CLOPF|nr:toll/interleukin-1 receptor domain-containing protein [Clostridium perfringens]SQC06959.1 Uncharacterised protein [Clostridium perfringens]
MNKLENLIKEGEEIRISSYTYNKGFECLSGEIYHEWLTKCKFFINNYCKDNIIKSDAINIINSVNIDSIINYEKLIGILKALSTMPESLGKKDIEDNKKRKIFVSHCSKDKPISNKFVDLLKIIGVKNEQLYYSSYEETGAEYLEDCFDRIEKEFNENELLVIFILSKDFYRSEVCMAETGATWVLCKKNYIPIILPPYRYSDIKGVLRNTQNSILLDDKEISNKLELLKLKIEEYLYIDNKVSSIEWNRKKEEFIQYIIKKNDNLEEVEKAIEDISIVESQIICKILIKNNTLNRERLEELQLNIVSKNGVNKKIEISDWTVKSIVVQPLEEVRFYISIGKIEEITKNSQIDKKNSTINIEYYNEK